MVTYCHIGSSPLSGIVEATGVAAAPQQHRVAPFDAIIPSLQLTQQQTSSCCRERRMLGLHSAILSPNLACYTGRRGTRTRRSTWARDCHLYVCYRKLHALSPHAPLVGNMGIMLHKNIDWEGIMLCNNTDWVHGTHKHHQH